MGDHLGAVGVAHAPGAAEVVGVGVGDDDRVDVLGLVAGPLQPVDERPPRLRARHAGIDDGDAALVLEEVAVHVAEARQHDRQLRAQDAGRHLGDLGGGRLRLLAAGPLGRRVPHAAEPT